jgi:hypothetical protein
VLLSLVVVKGLKGIRDRKSGKKEKEAIISNPTTYPTATIVLIRYLKTSNYGSNKNKPMSHKINCATESKPA